MENATAIHRNSTYLHDGLSRLKRIGVENTRCEMERLFPFRRETFSHPHPLRRNLRSLAFIQTMAKKPPPALAWHGGAV